jgi:hypothetical protein
MVYYITLHLLDELLEKQKVKYQDILLTNAQWQLDLITS